MSRYVFCVLFMLASADSLHAETVLDRKKIKQGPTVEYDDPAHDQRPSDPHNMFDRMNRSILEDLLEQRRKVKNDPALNRDPDKIIAKLPASSGALCPICREKLARHGEPGFKCIPKDINGDPIPVAEITWRQVQCPACSVQFKAAMPGNLNSKAGIDRDFCLHSIGRATVHSNVWSCPDCGYAAFIDSFGFTWDKHPISEETKAFVQREIRPVMFKRMCRLAGIKDDALNKPDPHGVKRFREYFQDDDWQLGDMISDWIKYDNAIKIYKQQKAPRAIMARLYLEAAHACRREVNGEIAVPSMTAAIEERLGLALRRINHDLNAAVIQIRQSRNQSAMIDPTKAETDAVILAEAAELIVQMGELTGDRIRQENRKLDARLDPGQFYSSGDMYILCLRYAAFLDRLGRIDPASRLMTKAKSFIGNPSAEGTKLPPEMAEFVKKQLDQLREYVDERQKRLELEREWLGRAMWENLIAVNNKNVRFTNPANLLAAAEKDQLDPAMTAYMIGELGRRSGEPSIGIAFLAAAEVILARQLSELDKEEAYLSANKDAPGTKAALERARKLKELWGILNVWTPAQLQDALQPRKDELANAKLDDTVKKVLDQVLQAAGIDPATFKIPAPKEAADAPATPAAKVAPTAPAGDKPPAVKPAATGAIKTRDELYKAYYAAISRYVKEKKSNPPNLLALVEAGYMAREGSCFSESGKFLVCPESGEPVQYNKSFEFGQRIQPVLYQTRPDKTAKILFANGEVRLITDK